MRPSLEQNGSAPTTNELCKNIMLFLAIQIYK